jgi:hypothetical protein
MAQAFKNNQTDLVYRILFKDTTHKLNAESCRDFVEKITFNPENLYLAYLFTRAFLHNVDWEEISKELKNL